MSNHHHHFLILTYPVHSHINPSLQLAYRLLRLSVKVTFATSTSTCLRISHYPKNTNINFVELPDTFVKCIDDSEGEVKDIEKLEIRQSCSAILSKVISTSNENGRPITCSVFTPTVPWVIDAMQVLPKPCVLLWTQPAAVLVIFYHFFFGYGEAMVNLFESGRSVELPGLPFSLEGCDLPTFMRPVNPHPWGLKLFGLQTKWMAEKENVNILVNTFESLEPDALTAIGELNLIPIGPLLPLEVDSVSAEDCSNVDYVKWLNSMPDRSVVYISFGSIWNCSNEQMEELARALLEAKRPFLWIIRTPPEIHNKEAEETEEEKKNVVLQTESKKELEQLGLIVPWCSQVEVLSHKSIGCFLTHCGWNSTLESLTAGVPMVGVPLWIEQVTNAKLVEEYWKCGVRACVNENDLVNKDEIKRCVELVMGNEGIRENAGKWKELAIRSAIGNSSAGENLSRFVTGLK